MGIRKKILLYFSLTTITLTGVTLFLIYILSYEFREEEFQQRQKEKIKTTLFFLSEIKNADKNLTEAFNRLTIHELLNEKLLIFDHNKELIYSSIDDTPVPYSEIILNKLTPQNVWFEGKDNLYDVVGLYFQNAGNTYYGISKALDRFGYSKLNYLKYVLLLAFIIITVIVIFIAYFLSKKITEPLISLTKQIGNYNFETENIPLVVKQTKNEIAILAEQFNKLMKRLNEVFSFQKHAIHHISHELKTPISVLVSNFEKIENETDETKIKALIKNQKEDTKNLSEIINALLEFTKVETGENVKNNFIRIDELIFDIADKLNILYPDFKYQIEYTNTLHENQLTVLGNARLLKAALTNLMQNCIQYSSNNKAKIIIDNSSNNLLVTFENDGSIINKAEEPFIFNQFFRGENSRNKRGFGLGLAFVSKIIILHEGFITYKSINENRNIFTISLPLS